MFGAFNQLWNNAGVYLIWVVGPLLFFFFLATAEFFGGGGASEGM